MTTDHTEGRQPDRRPGALVLLAGSGRPTAFTEAIGRTILDLPIRDGVSIFEHWLHQAEELSMLLGGEPLPVRLLVDHEVQVPRIPEASSGIELQVLKDPFEYRGTAGVLADLCRGMEDDEVLLTANATQLNLQPLASQYRQIAGSSAGVALVAPRDGTPVSVMLVQSRALSDVPEVGFCDLKEQALAGIAERFGVEVVRADHPVSYPLRAIGSYIRSLREYQRLETSHGGLAVNPYEEVWRSSFSIVEEGADVAESARVLDSVVLSGGALEAGSIAVRSIVCPGGRVRKDEVVIDRIVTAAAGGRARIGDRGRNRG